MRPNDKPNKEITTEWLHAVLKESHAWVRSLITIAASNVLWFIYQNFVPSESVRTPGGYIMIANYSSKYQYIKGYILIGLIIAAITIWSRTLLGLILSSLALAWVVTSYLIWWYKSFLTVKNAE